MTVLIWIAAAIYIAIGLFFFGLVWQSVTIHGRNGGSGGCVFVVFGLMFSALAGALWPGSVIVGMGLAAMSKHLGNKR